VRKLQSGQVWHERFGWLPKSYVARYDAGQRYFAKRWMSAEDEVRLRSEQHKPREIETEHYRVTTNHDLEEGVALGVQLERLYRAWQQTFARYYTSEETLTRMFDGAAAQRGAVRHFQVVYFRTRDEYNQALQDFTAADIGITTGIYLADRQCAYF